MEDYSFLKIIFLDIDGVLNVYTQGHDQFGSTFHPHLIENLRSIIEATGAKIVISSSWRSAGLEEMQLMWKLRDYPGEVIDVTPYSDINRGEDIAEWLRTNDCNRYVILDDNDDMMPDQLQYFVQTSLNQDHEDCVDIGYGLTKKCAEKAIAILNS